MLCIYPFGCLNMVPKLKKSKSQANNYYKHREQNISKLYVAECGMHTILPLEMGQHGAPVHSTTCRVLTLCGKELKS